jgi:hypothetical protein
MRAIFRSMLAVGRLAGIFVAVSLAFPAIAQVQTPARGSAQRAAILDTVRLRVEAEVGQPVEFVVNELRVLGEWVFTRLVPQRLGGGEIPWAYTRFQSNFDAGMFEAEVVALVRNTPAGLLLYEYDLGSTDVVWVDWGEWHPVPPELFP